MLARKYDNYAWQEEEQVVVSEPVRKTKVNKDPYRCLRNRVILVTVAILATYLITVVRSEAMISYGNQLVSMRKEESTLINKNSELKIEVEQLKGPERIIGLAEQRLGMSVARSNIYVKALTPKNNVNSLAALNK
ncbi:MAG: cell division protein FtsL [Phascolarctobacterium sp.]|nr:cell division protein FtsL [Phascolarctobacterium sp.]